MKGIRDEFYAIVRSYLTIYLPKQKACSENTIKAYSETINLLRTFMEEQKQIKFSKITFSMLNRAMILEFLDWIEQKRGCCVSTRNFRLAVIRAFFKYAGMENPSLMALHMELKRIPYKKTQIIPVAFLSEQALKILLAEPDRFQLRGIRNGFMMIFLYDTGARIQELLDLKLKDISLGSNVPFVYLTGKGQKTRSVPLQEKTIQHLIRYLTRFHPEEGRDPNKYLFYTIIHGCHCRMSEDTVATFLKKYSNSARKKCPEVPDRVYPHLFRHTKAMHLYQSGIPLSYIKDFLGHANLSTTDRYAYADTAMMKKALEKISISSNVSGSIGEWENDEDLILKLCGLK